jgi:hypothetical protein
MKTSDFHSHVLRRFIHAYAGGFHQQFRPCESSLGLARRLTRLVGVATADVGAYLP